MAIGRPKRPRMSDHRESLEYQLWLEEYGIEYAEAMLKKKMDTSKRAKECYRKPIRRAERDVVADIKEFLKGKVRTMWTNTTGGLIMGNKVVSNPNEGMPDLMGIMPCGTFFAFEVKSPDVKWPPRETIKNGMAYGDYRRYCIQKAWLDRLSGTGTVASFVSSVEQVATLLGLPSQEPQKLTGS